jgi:hypothetical protein
VAGFYSGATGTTPPLHWPTIAPEFTVSPVAPFGKRRTVLDLALSAFRAETRIVVLGSDILDPNDIRRYDQKS